MYPWVTLVELFQLPGNYVILMISNVVHYVKIMLISNMEN